MMVNLIEIGMNYYHRRQFSGDNDKCDLATSSYING